MALLNHAKKELSAKIVYYGPGLSGKTTNLEWIHRKLAPDKRGKLISLETKTDRTLFFDFLPVQIGEISGFRTRFNVYTVPGQIFYNETRRMVLKGVDGIVFVADSQKEMANENLENLKNLAENLRSIGKELSKIPLVIQFNKRDLPNILSVEEMNRLLNALGLPFFEAVAVKGEGVLTTLTRITRVVADHLKQTLFATPLGESPAEGTDTPSPSEARDKPARSSPDAPIQPSDSRTPAFLSQQPQAPSAAQAPEPQVVSRDSEITPYFDSSFGKKHLPKSPQPGLNSVSAPAAQSQPADDIPSLGDLGEPPQATTAQGPIPTVASAETPAPREVPPQKEAAPVGSSTSTDRVVPLERPTPVETAVPKPVSAPPPPEDSSKSYWVDPSLVRVSAEEVSTTGSGPNTQKSIALRFGEPIREAGNQVRIPVALRLAATNEILSFQMVIRVEQDQDEST